MATRRNTIQEGRAFFKRLHKEGPWAPIFILSGSERFLVLEAVERLIRSVSGEETDDFNFDTFDAREVAAADVIGACEMVPMFAERRVVRLRNLDHWKSGDLDALASYAANPLHSTLLVAEAGTLDKRLKAVKALTKCPEVVLMTFDGLDTRSTVEWAGRTGLKRKLRLSRQAAELLVESIGESLEQIDRALERIALYVNADKAEQAVKVGVDVIDEIVADTRIRSVFELTDALLERRLGPAIRMLRRMVAHGESPIGTIALLARQYRCVLLVKEGAESGADDRTLASRAGCPPFAVKKYRQAARQYSYHQLIELLQQITDTDALLKSSRLDDKLHVERLFISICRTSTRPGA